MAVDKAHKKTDVILSKLEQALRKDYSVEFAKLKKAIKESIADMGIDKSLTPIERYTQAQKYNRLEKIEETIASGINNINKQALKSVNNNLVDVYKTNYTSSIDELSVLFAISIPKVTNTEIKEEIKEEETPFDTLAINNAKDIVDLRKQVNRQFITSIMNGEDVNKLIKRMQKITELKLSDITRIARTQTTRIENLARLDAYKVVEKQGYKIVKQWVAVSDNRTRDAHKHADGQMVDMDEAFKVGGEKLMYPGDPNGSPENIINCRCTMRAGIRKL